MQQTKGLTLIEILISISLLGIMIAFIASSLASSFRITKDSRKSLDATSAAQRIIESIRGQWQSIDLYATNCAVITSNPTNSTFMTLEAKFIALKSDASTNGIESTLLITTAKPACGTSIKTCDNSVPANRADPLKRVIITAKDSADTSKTLARVTLDVVCPG